LAPRGEAKRASIWTWTLGEQVGRRLGRAVGLAAGKRCLYVAAGEVVALNKKDGQRLSEYDVGDAEEVTMLLMSEESLYLGHKNGLWVAVDADSE
jgi:hypothetical protein